MIDIKDFTEKETSGLVTLVRITEDTFAVSIKKFSAETGEELAKEVIGGNLKELTDRKVELQKELDEVNSFIKKLEVLVPQNKEIL